MKKYRKFAVLYLIKKPIMKKIILIIIILMNVFFLYSQNNYYNFCQTDKLNRSTIRHHYFYSFNNNEIVVKLSDSTRTYILNDSTKIIELIYNNYNSFEKIKKTVTHRNKNKLDEKIFIFLNDSLHEYKTTSYNSIKMQSVSCIFDNKNEIERKNFIQYNTDMSISYEYDIYFYTDTNYIDIYKYIKKNGILYTIKKHYFHGINGDYRIEYSIFNKAKQIIKTYDIDMKGDTNYIETFKYNSKGKLIEHIVNGINSCIDPFDEKDPCYSICERKVQINDNVTQNNEIEIIKKLILKYKFNTEECKNRRYIFNTKDNKIKIDISKNEHREFEGISIIYY